MKLKQYESVRTWLKKMSARTTGSKKTERDYLRKFQWFIDWTGKDPDQLLVEAREKQTPDYSWAEEKAIDFFTYLTTEYKAAGRGKGKKGEPMKRTSAKSIYNIVRSFFRYNRIPFLDKSPKATGRERIDIPTKDELMKVYRAASLHEKVALHILNDTGMSPEDAVNLTFGDVKRDYERGETHLYIEKVREKTDLWFGTFISRLGTEVIRDSLEMRKRKGETITDSTPIIGRRRGKSIEPITPDMLWWMIRKVGDRVGVYLPPKIFRKRFRTFGSPIIGRDAIQKMGGWKIPGAGEHYYSPPRNKALELYLKIEPIIAFGEVVVSDEQRILEQLRLQIASLPISEKKRQELLRVARLRKFKASTEAGEWLRKQLRETKMETNGGNCANGHNCQRIVSEEELPNLLAQGWRVSAVLPSGKLIVER